VEVPLTSDPERSSNKPSVGSHDKAKTPDVTHLKTTSQKLFQLDVTKPPVAESRKKLTLPQPSKMVNRTCMNKVSNNYHFYASQAVREATRNKGLYVLGCSSVFIVVYFVTILTTVIAYSPLIFLGIAESTSGQLDFRLWARKGDTVNYTAIEDILAGDPVLSYSTPRYEDVSVDVAKAQDCYANEIEGNDLLDVRPLYLGPNDSPKESFGAIRDACKSDYSLCMRYQCVSTTGVLTLIDSTKERNMGIGRDWPFPPLSAGSVYIQTQLALDANNLSVGDTAYISIPFKNKFPSHYKEIVKRQPNITDYVKTIYMPVKIAGMFDFPLGKYPMDKKNILFMEYGSFLDSIGSYGHPNVSASFQNQTSYMSKGNAMYEYANHVLFSCGKQRTDCYMSNNFAVNAYNVLRVFSDAVLKLGYKSVGYSLPVLDSLDDTSFFSSFLSMILSLVVILLSSLSVFLIYSLLMVSVETKTFEMSIFRMVGLTRSGIMQYIVIEALSYSIPAWASGLILAQVTFYFVRDVLKDVFGMGLSTLVTPDSVALASLLGLLIPVVSAILPIRNALGQNLHDAHDQRRSKVKGVQVTINRSSQGTPSAARIFIGLFLTVYGFVMYYFLPLGLLQQATGGDVSLLFGIFLVLLIGMLLGLVLLGLNFQPLLEIFIVRILFLLLWFENRFFSNLILSNLVAHRPRLKKTSLT
jgi:hypothetical protein